MAAKNTAESDPFLSLDEKDNTVVLESPPLTRALYVLLCVNAVLMLVVAIGLYRWDSPESDYSGKAGNSCFDGWFSPCNMSDLGELLTARQITYSTHRSCGHSER
jgi:hypothetical protein